MWTELDEDVFYDIIDIDVLGGKVRCTKYEAYCDTSYI